MNLIRKFLYRSPRFSTAFRMDFIQGDAVFLGTCTDLSESGLRGTFSDCVPPGAEGIVTLYHEDRPFQIQAKIRSIRGEEARMRFNLASDKERATVTELIKILTAGMRP